MKLWVNWEEQRIITSEKEFKRLHHEHLEEIATQLLNCNDSRFTFETWLNVNYRAKEIYDLSLNERILLPAIYQKWFYEQVDEYDCFEDDWEEYETEGD